MGDAIHYIHLLQGEVGELWKSNSDLHMELDHSNERISSLQRSLATVSVEFLALQDQFSHFIDCHWAPLQHFHAHLSSYFTSPPLPSTPISLSPSLLPSSPQLESQMVSLSLCSWLDLGVNLPSPHYSPTALPLPPHLVTPPLPNISIERRDSSTSRKERKVRPYQACRPSKGENCH